MVSGERSYFQYSEAKLVRDLLEVAIENRHFVGSIEMDSVDTVEHIMEFEDDLEAAI